MARAQGNLEGDEDGRIGRLVRNAYEIIRILRCDVFRHDPLEVYELFGAVSNIAAPITTENRMPKLNITDQAILMCQLAEHQDKLDEAVEAATIEYLRATEYLQKRLNTLRAAINLRDSMAVVRNHIVGGK